MRDGMLKNQTYAANSYEAKKRNDVLVNFIACSGMPTHAVANVSFISLCSVLDHKYKVPGKSIE